MQGMKQGMKQGLGLMGLAAVLVVVFFWMDASSDEQIAANAGPTAIAAAVCLIAGAVMVARGLMPD